jgi:hypothetical protein
VQKVGVFSDTVPADAMTCYSGYAVLEWFFRQSWGFLGVPCCAQGNQSGATELEGTSLDESALELEGMLVI